MKALFITVLLTLAVSVSATSDSSFEICTSRDRSLLQAATSLGNEAINDLVENEVIQNEIHCYVSKSTIAHPAVCGTNVVQINTFLVDTSTRGSYSIVVDSSYSSCARMRVVPMIKSLTFTPTIDPINFP